MSIAPEQNLKALLNVLHVCSYKIRLWTLDDSISRKQINALWNAIHDIPLTYDLPGYPVSRQIGTGTPPPSGQFTNARAGQCENRAYLTVNFPKLATPFDSATLARFAGGTRFGEI